MRELEFSRIFPDNLDKSCYKLSSFDELFFDIFKKKNLQCDLNIANTLILEKGKPK